MSKLIKIKKYKYNSFIYYVRYFVPPMLRKIRIRKCLNILHTLWDWKIKNTILKSSPFVFRLEPSTLCNLRCPKCPTPVRMSNGNLKRMTLQNFKLIYDLISKYVYRLTFYIDGEPLTNPNLFDMIKIAGNDKVFTSFCTNFTLMKPELIEPLFNSKLDLISICLDGYSQEVYQQYRVNGDVEKVKNGIKMVMEYKKKHKLNYPYVNIYTIKFNHVLPEVEKIELFCKEENVDQLTFRPDQWNIDGSYLLAKESLLPKSKCFWPWLNMSIDAEGSVYPCPVAWTNRNPYGNILKETLDNIWNNELYVETREYLTDKNDSQKTSNLKIPCHTCRWYGDKNHFS
ncbi:MAG TPA: radical SAM protein [Ignavibacteriaceae bacterium]|nr:radical SAM protein [Ignavibacteriaceae bacterium]